MSSPDVPAFPHDTGDGNWRPPRRERVVYISSEQHEHDDARRRARQAPQQHYEAPQPGEAAWAPKVQVFNADGSVPAAPPPPLMPHLAPPERNSARAVPLRPPQPAPMTIEEFQRQCEREAVNAAWAARERADAEESARRERDYWRYQEAKR